MSSDGESKHPDQDHRAAGAPSVLDDSRSSRGVPLTTIGLCGLGMIMVGGGMGRVGAERWWAWLALAAVLILILYMGMRQERWLTRERHRLILSALKRTGTLYGSRELKEKTPRSTCTRRGGKPIEKGLSRSVRGEAPAFGEDEVPEARGVKAGREEVLPGEMTSAETMPSTEMEKTDET